MNLLQKFQVSVSNDSAMECVGMIKGMKSLLESYQLSSDFYVVNLTWAAVFLEEQWLKTFGEFQLKLD